MIRVAILAAVIALAGCEQQPQYKIRTDNPNIPVEYLFTHDGCKVYRFEDGRSRYFVKCIDREARAQTMTDESCGKNCTTVANIQTFRD